MMSRRESKTILEETQDFRISRMTEHDLLEVVEIEEASDLSRWGWNAYHSELMHGSAALMFVARGREDENLRSGARLKGFIAARLIADELHVNNVGVREEHRSQGIGRALLKTVLTEGKRSGAKYAFLEVRASNSLAQALYGRCGFGVTGRRRNYYSEPTEDALIMSLAIQSLA
jgi:ribosomal-protein-alanine N-acetyltransferase